ncbi:MAG: NAD(P)/FAD-dependent oxidoreductase [Peptococcaceae bacterium]|jgi:predicted Rossmann fold flavoprotein|nr:NAD(P)/FAD-dependent oxidoreductase [Peptococcaceae bacterium]
MTNRQVLVVGGGAAGMMAAGQAAQNGATACLLEKQERLGSKIAISGKGRCNLTQAARAADLIQAYPGNGRFLQGILHEFDSERLRQFLAGYGLETKIERGGRVFPLSDRAEDVVRALSGFLRENAVRIQYRQSVREILVDDGRVCGVRTAQGVIPGGAVIVCTGGASYPATGSTGDGYALARMTGHTLIEPRPALVPLRARESWVKDLQGLSLRNVTASLWIQGKKKAAEFGELLFTHFGVSGPIVLTLSRTAGQAVSAGEEVILRIDLKPALREEQLDARIRRDFFKYTNKQFKHALEDVLPKSLIPVMIQLSGIAPDQVVHQITREERKRLVNLLKALPLTVTGALPIEAAIVTAGGVNVKEIDPKTLASRKVAGLYWAGEVVDVDGITGGYNLQAAFAMGYRAGRAAARYVADAR